MVCLSKTVLHFLVGVLSLAYCTVLLAEPPGAEAAKNAEPPGAEAAAEAEPPEAGKFLRVERDARDRPVAMQTAVVRYVSASGERDVVVDLIAAVHVADRSYYEQLNEQFEEYDALLYELVAPEGKTVPEKDPPTSYNPLAWLQQATEETLELESQMEHIDYSKENFVHADLSPEEMAKAIQRRGDNFITLVLNITADLMRQRNLRKREALKNLPKNIQPEDVDPFALFFSPHAAVNLKRSMAEEFERSQSNGGGLGETLNTILIEDRNKEVMSVLRTEMAHGKKQIGIFYGAGHMADFEKRLAADFGLKRESEKWLNAWNLQVKRRPHKELSWWSWGQ